MKSLGCEFSGVCGLRDENFCRVRRYSSCEEYFRRKVMFVYRDFCRHFGKLQIPSSEVSSVSLVSSGGVYVASLPLVAFFACCGWWREHSFCDTRVFYVNNLVLCGKSLDLPEGKIVVVDFWGHSGDPTTNLFQALDAVCQWLSSAGKIVIIVSGYVNFSLSYIRL
jgi:hypothetical protein